MDIVAQVKDHVLTINQTYKTNSSDHYDFWEQHISFVVKEALYLAEKYGADPEIVELGAMLHDIALMANCGSRKDHHINGQFIAEQLLSEMNYPNDKAEKVLGCILHHRSSTYAENIEELCVSDADIMAHYDNIPMCFNAAFKANIISIKALKQYFSHDYEELSDNSKILFKQRYETIMDVLFGTFD